MNITILGQSGHVPGVVMYAELSRGVGVMGCHVVPEPAALGEEAKTGWRTKRQLDRAPDVTRINPVRERFLC
jgi:hypothetical protein